jgi:ribosomal protein S18 acetylase RimI-like enzyme
MRRDEAGLILKAEAALSVEALVELYSSVGWDTYARDPERLQLAVAGSSYVVSAWRGGELAGLARCLSDDVSVTYIQDVLVHPEARRLGLGRALLVDCLERYAQVRQVVLLTDDRPEQLAFYAALGFRNTRALVDTPLNAFVKIRGAELS